MNQQHQWCFFFYTGGCFFRQNMWACVYECVFVVCMCNSEWVQAHSYVNCCTSTAKHTNRQLMVCFTREVYGFFNVKEINCDVQEILLSTLFTQSLWVEDKKKGAAPLITCPCGGWNVVSVDNKCAWDTLLTQKGSSLRFEEDLSHGPQL